MQLGVKRVGKDGEWAERQTLDGRNVFKDGALDGEDEVLVAGDEILEDASVEGLGECRSEGRGIVVQKERRDLQQEAFEFRDGKQVDSRCGLGRRRGRR